MRHTHTHTRVCSLTSLARASNPSRSIVLAGTYAVAAWGVMQLALQSYAQQCNASGPSCVVVLGRPKGSLEKIKIKKPESAGGGIAGGGRRERRGRRCLPLPLLPPLLLPGGYCCCSCCLLLLLPACCCCCWCCFCLCSEDVDGRRCVFFNVCPKTSVGLGSWVIQLSSWLGGFSVFYFRNQPFDRKVGAISFFFLLVQKM